MKTISFWKDDFPGPDNIPISPLPEQVDVVIVGGGYTGLSLARTLANDGVSTSVFEQERLGWGASSRNGGMATPWLRADIEGVIRRHGRAAGEGLWRASLEAIDYLAAIIADEGIQCDLDRRGHIILANNAKHFDQLGYQSDLFASLLDYEMPLLSAAEVSREIGSDRYYGGLIDEWSASVHPTRFFYGLAAAAARSGARLCEKTRVIGLVKESGGFAVHTSQGECKAQEVVLATNGYTDLLEPGIRRGVIPVTRYALVTDALRPEQQQQLSPNGRMFSDSYWVPNQFRLTPDGRVLFTGFIGLKPRMDPSSTAKYLRAKMLNVFPQLQKVPTAYSWRGELATTFDLLPHIGRINGVHFALGYNGNGLAMSLYLGYELAQLLLGEKRKSPFLHLPLPTRFYYRQRPWFIPLVSTYMRWRQRFS